MHCRNRKRGGRIVVVDPAELTVKSGDGKEGWIDMEEIPEEEFNFFY
jgi:hypothetical protein